jgi:hypothetical protein
LGIVINFPAEIVCGSGDNVPSTGTIIFIIYDRDFTLS